MRLGDRQRWGHGQARTALLLHGATASHRTWWQIGPVLAAHGWDVTAVDLPNHGQADSDLELATPRTIAAQLVSGLEPIDLLVGHSLGAAVALALLGLDPGLARGVVLEELPGPDSVDWDAEADGARTGHARSASAPAQAMCDMQADNPGWQPDDVRHAVEDLARCRVDGIAAGLRTGRSWPRLHPSTRPADVRILLLLAPDQPGLNRGDPGTALRERDRREAMAAADHWVELDSGHCIHRDRPLDWCTSVVDIMRR